MGKLAYNDNALLVWLYTGVHFELPGTFDEIGYPLSRFTHENSRAQGHAALTGGPESSSDLLFNKILAFISDCRRFKHY